jgi:hypothetical protein
MNLETLPVLLAVVVGLCGLALVADGWMADPARAGAERRRHARAERHRGGEVAAGLGFLCAAAALGARDTWAYGAAALLLAALLVLAGAALNARFLRQQLSNRGVLRRGRRAERRRANPALPADDPARRPHDRRLAERRGPPPPSPRS